MTRVHSVIPRVHSVIPRVHSVEETSTLQSEGTYSTNMKPVPLSAYIPPVTGVGGNASLVVSNSFDSNGFFPTRPRANSKRRRNENDDYDRFDITRDFPPLVLPDRQILDVAAVEALMVDAAEMVPAIRAKAEDADEPEDTRSLAKFSLKLFLLLEAVVEKAVRPLSCAPPPMGTGAGRGPPPVPPKPKPDTQRQELIDALALADRTAILHDANLGSIPIANRQKLCGALSAGIRESALKKAEGAGADPAEAIRIADDALSLVKDMTFLGQVSKKANNTRRPDLTHMTMPIKLEFDDRSARIHFERTMLAQCNLRASISLPKAVRTAQNKFHDLIREKYPEEITMVRTDTLGLTFKAFHKAEGGPKWLPCMEIENIPLNILQSEAINAHPAGTAGGTAPTAMVVG